MFSSIDQHCINTIRTLSIDMVQQANSGHPGLPLGAAPMAYVLWKHFLTSNPQDTQRSNRDRFILSAGHGSALLYSLLHLSGHSLALQDLQQFRQAGSKTPGHPENTITDGVEVTTGPLGQGVANAVGMAIAEVHLAATYNTTQHQIIDHYTYVISSDGDHMEGISGEAASLAGHLKLGKLIVLYDSNQISIEGNTNITFSEDVGMRYQAYGRQVIHVTDGDTDLQSIHDAIQQAQNNTTQPSLIIINTTIGFGSPNKAGSASSHGSPLGDDEVTLTKQALGREHTEPFFVAPTVREHMQSIATKGAQAQQQRQTLRNDYQKTNSDEANELRRRLNGTLPTDRQDALTACLDETGATRALSGNCINALAPIIPELIGGSADLAPSTKNIIKGEPDFQANNYAARNIRFGVREHAMGAIANGMALHGGCIPQIATFLMFADYMRPAIRLAALSHLRVLFIMTHDSIALGEDGPTHQPIGTLASLRAIPNLLVMRPADATETVAAYHIALQQTQTPSLLALTRQKLPAIPNTNTQQATQGAYIVYDSPNPEYILLASGSELHIAVQAAEQLADQGTQGRVVSMFCMELFDQQPMSYQQKVLPASITHRIAIEAGSSLGWHKYTGLAGTTITVDRFGASAPGPNNMTNYGFTVQNITKTVQHIIK